MNVALKEWASVVNALELGSQILLLRKGGIAESASGGFKLRYPEFLFFPTFEHQHRDYLKTSYTKPLSSPSDSLEIGLIGRVSHVITARSL
ncbi:MAG TPA: DUF1802 family protein, partial [Bryobacteraceae bacterium]|nr:DUF1802 family protein [Bryobacteraceae bacterium]